VNQTSDTEITSNLNTCSSWK